MGGCSKNHKTPGPGGGVPFRLGDIYAQKTGWSLLLVFVDLDIARGGLILPEEQKTGAYNCERGKESEQSFENFHGSNASLESLARSGGVPQGLIVFSIAYSARKGKRCKQGQKQEKWNG